ncbi:hypothetical protein FHW84_003434 [Dyella sp. SG562]|uniref:hypothetical protein n=1 Tax=Dyella sp. SG562 TaxID=2587017 RepID=UPI00142086AA|nr:hypothetical protein [Dyella sp. SG562]NII74838.1 hypothetical protein [Dyella sp. SG562]
MATRPILAPDVRQKILSIVSLHWETNGAPLLLSRLGQLLRTGGVDLTATFGSTKMVDALRLELDENLIVKTLPENPTIVVVAPRNAGAAANVAIQALDQSPPKNDDSPAIPRYNKAIWAAFSWPIKPGQVRTVSLEPVAFKDVDANLAISAATKKISPALVVTRTANQDPKEHQRLVAQAITKWAKDSGVAESELLASNIAKKSANAGDSLLSRMIEALSPDQLQRVALPLDVVDRLLKS